MRSCNWNHCFPLWITKQIIPLYILQLSKVIVSEILSFIFRWLGLQNQICKTEKRISAYFICIKIQEKFPSKGVKNLYIALNFFWIILPQIDVENGLPSHFHLLNKVFQKIKKNVATSISPIIHLVLKYGWEHVAIVTTQNFNVLQLNDQWFCQKYSLSSVMLLVYLNNSKFEWVSTMLIDSYWLKWLEFLCALA